MSITFMENNKVMRFFFLNRIFEDGFHLIVAKVPSNLPPSEFLFEIKEVSFSEQKRKQVYLHARNEFREISIPLDYDSYAMQRMFAKTYGIDIDYYDNGYGELGDRFPMKNLEDILCIDIESSEIPIDQDVDKILNSIRVAVVKRLFDVGYIRYMFHVVNVTDDILIEF